MLNSYFLKRHKQSFKICPNYYYIYIYTGQIWNDCCYTFFIISKLIFYLYLFYYEFIRYIFIKKNFI